MTIHGLSDVDVVVSRPGGVLIVDKQDPHRPDLA